jgi:hypothetical protein
VSKKFDQLQRARESTRDIELKAALYKQVAGVRLPMSKLLSDISSAAPVGVLIEELRITPEKGVSLRGTAASRDLVNKLEQAIIDCKVFSDVKRTRVDDQQDGSVAIDFEFKVAKPHEPFANAPDFATESLAEKLYGKGASNTAIPVGAVVQKATPPKTATTGGSATASRRPAATPSDAPPPAVTEEEIAKMSNSELLKGWTSRNAYLKKFPGLEAPVRDRLKAEEEKMKEQQRKLREGAAKP